MGTRSCEDCGKPVTGHNGAKRCMSCSAKRRYIQKFGKPPEILIADCGTCGLKFEDYATNHTNSKHGVYFCSAACRAAWTGIHNSISRGRDGTQKPKKEKDASYYRRHAERYRQRMRDYYTNNRQRVLNKRQERDKTLKLEIIKEYGGQCDCCGEQHFEFLTIDHINGDGAEHRSRCGKGRRVYADLKKLGFPKDGFRLLCLNCNISLGFYGYCPHNPEQRRQVDKRPKNPGRPRTVK